MRFLKFLFKPNLGIVNIGVIVETIAIIAIVATVTIVDIGDTVTNKSGENVVCGAMAPS